MTLKEFIQAQLDRKLALLAEIEAINTDLHEAYRVLGSVPSIALADDPRTWTPEKARTENAVSEPLPPSEWTAKPVEIGTTPEGTLTFPDGSTLQVTPGQRIRASGRVQPNETIDRVCARCNKPFSFYAGKQSGRRFCGPCRSAMAKERMDRAHERKLTQSVDARLATV